MKRPALLGALAALALIGCGGGGASTNLTVASNYRGSYTGTWTSPTLNDGGTIAFSVSDNGAVNGTMTRKVGTGNLVGTIDSTGRMYATAGDSTGAGTYVLSGNVAFQSGHLISSFAFNFLGHDYGGNFDVSSAVAAGG